MGLAMNTTQNMFKIKKEVKLGDGSGGGGGGLVKAQGFGNRT